MFGKHLPRWVSFGQGLIFTGWIYPINIPTWANFMQVNGALDIWPCQGGCSLLYCHGLCLHGFRLVLFCCTFSLCFICPVFFFFLFFVVVFFVFFFVFVVVVVFVKIVCRRLLMLSLWSTSVGGFLTLIAIAQPTHVTKLMPSLLNPYLPSWIINPYQMDQSISILGVCGMLIHFYYIFYINSVSKQWRSWSDAASDLGLHCLPISL